MDYSTMGLGSLSSLAGNCIFALHQNTPLREEALDRIVGAYIYLPYQWDEKLSPIHALGYSAGHHRPMKQEQRRAILLFAFANPLPERIGDGWGDPLSDHRRRRITGALSYLITKYNGYGGYERVCSEWADDLRFVQSDEFPAHAVPLAPHELPAPNDKTPDG